LDTIDIFFSFRSKKANNLVIFENFISKFQSASESEKITAGRQKQQKSKSAKEM
jgi:hypothetical protein